MNQINILNHYIGMKKIIPAEISELHVIPWVFGLMIFFGLAVALWKRRGPAVAWILTKIMLGIVGLLDFYRWGYQYGHSLDPEAPIKIPGLSYQPPLIGHKTILNIDSYSIPDIGGYMLAASFLLAVIGVLGVNLAQRQWAAGTLSPGISRANRAVGRTGFLLLVLIFINSCTAPKVEAIKIDEDQCDSCRMTITDPRFGGEIITVKGRTYKFDSVTCLLHFVAHEKTDVKTVLIEDYFNPGSLIDAKKAHFLRGGPIEGPMGSKIIATLNETDLKTLTKTSGGEKVLDWDTILSSAG